MAEVELTVAIVAKSAGRAVARRAVLDLKDQGLFSE
jgi:hypothetical protein